MTPLTLAVGLLVLVVLLVLLAVAAYNSLVRARNAVKNGWNQIDVQLMRRHDLIPNLVETVKGYAKHERELLDEVIRARSAAQSAPTHAQRIAAEGALEASLGRLLAVAESYPDVKANENFLSLQEELASTENRVAFARQHYNDSVMRYDTRRQSFPAVMMAGALGFEPEPYWKTEEPAQRAAPKVAF